MGSFHSSLIVKENDGHTLITLVQIATYTHTFYEMTIHAHEITGGIYVDLTTFKMQIKFIYLRLNYVIS
jgi:hypothetical protein